MHPLPYFLPLTPFSVPSPSPSSFPSTFPSPSPIPRLLLPVLPCTHNKVARQPCSDCAVLRARILELQALQSQPPARTFATTLFKPAYVDARPAKYAHDLLSCVHSLVVAFCALRKIPASVGEAFFKSLQKQAQQRADLLEGDVSNAAQFLWTSAVTMEQGTDTPLELCSLINEAIRLDAAPLVSPLAVLSRSINQLCVVRAKGPLASTFPPGGVVFRGSRLPSHVQHFYVKEKKYRVPGLLATSFSRDKATEFLVRAHINDMGSLRQPVVLWRVHLDPRGAANPAFRCMHVNLVQHAAVAGEEEFLFAPYSVFTVRATAWNAGTAKDPHVVDLDAANDNAEEPEDLPLAPWY